MKKESKKTDNFRLLAEGFCVNNDTRETGLNNNDLIIGPSGAGKTGGYVIPNIEQYNTSMIVADTKGNLCKKLSGSLKKNGFKVHVVDFINLDRSSAYNPFDYIGIDKRTGEYSEKDIMTISNLLFPQGHFSSQDGFWVDSAKNVVASLIGFVLEAFAPEERHLGTVVKVYKILTDQAEKKVSDKSHPPTFFDRWAEKYPGSFSIKKYNMYKSVFSSERTWASIAQFVSNALAIFDFKEADNMFSRPADFRIEDIGREKSIIFLNISDYDRTFDTLVNLFYTQALQALTIAADNRPDSRLEVPVRIILDDFATNAYIPDFEKIISVIRSREISVSIILQSLTQLKTLYSDAASKTIINNCDHILYLGGTDLETIHYICNRVGKCAETVISLPLDKVYVMERGKRGVMMNKIVPYSNNEIVE